MSESSNSNVQRMFENIKRLVALHLDYARLTAAEKVTVILSAMAFYALVVVLGMLALVFLTVGAGQLLSIVLAPHWSFMIVAGFYVILLVLLFVFRKQMFVNPIAKFISKLFVNPPKND